MALVFALALVFMAGASLGSFGKLVWDRRGHNLFFPGSHCPECGRSLPWPQKIPVISFLGLAGRCRFCRQPIPASYFWVEVISGSLSLAVAVFFLHLG